MNFWKKTFEPPPLRTVRAPRFKLSASYLKVGNKTPVLSDFEGGGEVPEGDSRGARDSLEGKPQSTIVDKFWEKFSQKRRRGGGSKDFFSKIHLFLSTEASSKTVTTF